MKIKVKFIPRNTCQEVEVPHGTTVTDLLRTMQLRPDAVIVLRNNTPIPIDDVLESDQELCLFQVASGG
jgi:sulfur carrier protein ThiS